MMHTATLPSHPSHPLSLEQPCEFALPPAVAASPFPAAIFCQSEECSASDDGFLRLFERTF